MRQSGWKSSSGATSGGCATTTNTSKREAEPEEAIDYVLAAESDEAPSGEGGDGGEQPLVIAEMRTAIPQLTVSEAVMRLDLADLPVLLFRNSARGTSTWSIAAATAMSAGSIPISAPFPRRAREGKAS